MLLLHCLSLPLSHAEWLPFPGPKNLGQGEGGEKMSGRAMRLGVGGDRTSNKYTDPKGLYGCLKRGWDSSRKERERERLDSGRQGCQVLLKADMAQH